MNTVTFWGAVVILTATVLSGCGTTTDTTEIGTNSSAVKPNGSDNRVTDSPTELTNQAMPKLLLPDADGTPLYCTITIGNGDTNMVAVLVGEQLYFDANANGDLRDSNECFSGELELELDGTRFVNFFIGDLEFGGDHHSDMNFRIAFGKSDVRGSVSMMLDGFVATACSSQGMEMTFEQDLEKAPVICFGGELTMDFDHHPVQLNREIESEFYVHVGTAGRGIGTLTAIEYADIPQDVHPKFEFVFQNAEQGGEPIVVSGFLEHRC